MPNATSADLLANYHFLQNFFAGNVSVFLKSIKNCRRLCENEDYLLKETDRAEKRLQHLR